MKQSGVRNDPSELTSITNSQLLPHLSDVKGDTRADYILVSFTDYQCPACKMADVSIQDYLSKNSDKVGYAVVNFPLSYHKKAKDMAIFAAMNSSRGDFWAVHSRLMQGKTPFDWRDCSKDLKPCRDPILAKAKAKVDEDVALGERVPITATPTHLLYSKKSGKLFKLDSLSQIGTSIKGVNKLV